MKKLLEHSQEDLNKTSSPGNLCPFSSSDREIHKSKNKSAIYCEEPKLRWSSELDRWLCFDPTLIKEVLKSDDFQVNDYFRTQEILTNHLGLNVEHTSRLLSQFPFCHDGKFHKELKKIYAKKLNEHHETALLQFEASLKELITLKFKPGTTLDLVEEIIAPAIVSAASIFSGIQSHFEGNSASIAQLLDETISVSRRMKINKKIEDFIIKFPKNTSEEIAFTRVGLAVTGLDSLVGALSESIVSLLNRDPNLKLSQIQWDENLPATSIPFIERTLTKDTILQGEQLKIGQTIRVYLDAGGYSKQNPTYSDLYFGAGTHTCIGKSFSKELWTVFTKCLSKVDLRLQIIKSARRDHDYFFNGYYLLMVTVNP
ncbi:cytochrome P450 [Polynucleobacter asymbioticus]|jgi:cytochrome P450|uniref:Cytochrome P450 n=1 Tax=Polynucleobacter asymbioticus TaxID=576611 RepID=A0AAC9IQI4_9BURK|nr:cytochrome P450 [Polynucleobacter asymbioticus]APB98210.1 hypothetical protein A4F89_02085 [Polynucleobacter asymbioticus]APC00496.1 hypothetical protein AOC25_02090 [Polynucleobacter asymbioticus]